jgi:hypothetical protein
VFVGPGELPDKDDQSQHPLLVDLRFQKIRNRFQRFVFELRGQLPQLWNLDAKENIAFSVFARARF